MDGVQHKEDTNSREERRALRGDSTSDRGPQACPMSALLSAAGYIQKDATNPDEGYRYASDTAVTRQFRTAMSELGLRVDSSRMELLSYKGGTAIVKVSIVLACGKMFYGPYEGLGMAYSGGDKAVMMAETAARKYAISQAALLSWGDDPEQASPVVEHRGEAPEMNSVKFVLEAAASLGLDNLRKSWEGLSDDDRMTIQEHYPKWWNNLKQEAGNG